MELIGAIAYGAEVLIIWIALTYEDRFRRVDTHLYQRSLQRVRGPITNCNF